MIRVRLSLLEYAGSHSPDELLQKALDEIGSLTNSPIRFYHFISDDEKNISLQAWSSRTVNEFCQAEREGLHYSVDQGGVWADAVRERRPVVHNDYATLSHRKGMPEGHATVIRELVVPIIKSGRIVSIVGIGNKPTDYTEKDVEVVSYLGDVAWEIFERKIGEIATAESEKRYRSLFENMLDGFAYCKMCFEDGKPCDFIYLDVNDSFERLTGLKNVVGKKVSEVIPGIRESRPELLETYGRVALTGNPEKAEIFVDSLGIWFTLSVYSPKREYFVSVFDNITEQKLAGRALMESEAQKAAILDGMTSNIIFVHEDMRVRWANKAAADSVGKSPDQLLGKTCHSLWGNSDKPCDKCPTVITFKTKKSQQARIVSPDGRVWEEKGEPVFDAQGTLTGVVKIALDITERVRAEEERESLRSQLLQAQKMEAVGTLAGGVAHDFNNLLQVVSGYSEILLLDKKQDHSEYKSLLTINSSAKRGADLVKRLMVFSRKADTELRPLNLNHEITEIRKLLERTIPKMISIELSLEGELPVINADPVQLEQILMNLAINAKDAMPETGGKLTIETKNVTLDEEYCRVHFEAKPGQFVMLSVSDTGHGMSQDTLQHIFEPFFTTKGVGKGTGLGLAMVYGIVKQHGGFINCYSRPNQGTTFQIYFPSAPTELEENLEVATQLPPGGSETILLVDDEEFVCDMGSKLLTRAGYTVLTETSGRDALNTYRNKSDAISLVILDLIMPEMGGKECFQELANINPKVKVILSSGFLSDGTTQAAKGMGAKGFIQKPHNMRQLLGMVREVLDAH